MKKDGSIWLSRYESAKHTWNTMKPWWDECRRYTMPTDGSYADGQVKNGVPTVPPVDVTAIDLLEKMASGLHSSTISYGDRWFNIVHNGGGDSWNMWCSQATRGAIMEMQKSNFLSVSHQWIRHTCGYGTGLLYTAEVDGAPMYRNIPITDNVCLETDMFGNVCVVYIAYELTALQAVQQFGIDNPALGDDIKREFRDASSVSQKTHTFIHVVYPKKLFGEKFEVASDDEEFPYEEKYRPYGGLFVCKETQAIVSEDGFFEFPFAVPRPIGSQNAIYGSSIPMVAMYAIKQLNRATGLMFDASEMTIRPPIGVPAGFPKLNLVPGAVMKCPITSQNQIWTYTTQANIPVGDNLIARYTEVLRSLFKEDFFMAVQKRGEMTAVEVAERVRQASDFISPMVMNIQHDGFRPIVLRTIGILERSGKIPRRPRDKRNIEIAFQSRIDSMIRQADASRDLQLVNQMANVGQAMQVNPDINNVVRVDALYDELREAMGVHADVFYTQRERVANRQKQLKEQQIAQQEAMRAQLLGKTDMAKDIAPNSPIAKGMI